MSKAESLRNSIIDRILVINDLDYLKAIHRIIQPAHDQIYSLTAEQKSLVQQSLKDAEEGKLMSQEEFEVEQTKWLKEK